MSDPPANSESAEVLHEYLRSEILRAQKELTAEQWEAILVGFGDEGEVGAFPCRLLVPFHYPATIAELDKRTPEHFLLPLKSWELRWQPIREFAEQYGEFAAIDDTPEAVHATARHRLRRINVLRDACVGFDPALTIFGLASDDETWWEVLTFHGSGPRLPPPPLPVSDVQLLARLCRHTNMGVGKSSFGIENGVITEVGFDGADTSDATIDLLRGIPNLRDLLKALQKVSLKRTLITDRSLRFLRKTLPHVELDYSHYFED